MLTEATGQVQIDVPRDRAGTFEPQIVKKRQRRQVIEEMQAWQARPLDEIYAAVRRTTMPTDRKSPADQAVTRAA